MSKISSVKPCDLFYKDIRQNVSVLSMFILRPVNWMLARRQSYYDLVPMLSSYEHKERKRKTLSTKVVLQVLCLLYFGVILHDFYPDQILILNIKCDSGCAGQSFSCQFG